MPDPKECRRYALECVWLAQVPEFPQARKAYLSAAKTWLKLANELGFATAIEKNQSSLSRMTSNTKMLVEDSGPDICPGIEGASPRAAFLRR
jgi:hypothetical protein